MTRAGLILATVAVALSGCSLSLFDDISTLEDQVWVDISGPPSGLPSQLYPLGLAAAGGDEPGAKVIAIGGRRNTITSSVYDISGNIAQEQVELQGLDDIDEEVVVKGDPEAERALLGVEASGTPSVVVLDLGNQVPSAGDQIAMVAPVGESPAPAADVAFFDDGGTRAALVATAAGTVQISDYAGASPMATPCGVGTGGLSVAADSTTGVAVVGTGSAVVAFNVDIFATDPCTVSTIQVSAPGGATEFGRQVALADLDGSAGADLVVAAAGQVFVYFNPGLLTLPPSDPEVIDSPDSSDGFGEQIAIGDFSGDGVADLVIADSNVSIDGVSQAGAVYLYTADGGNVSEPATLHVFEPQAAQRFGTTLAVARFGGDADVLAVGTESELFTYFRFPFSGSDDPREGR